MKRFLSIFTLGAVALASVPAQDAGDFESLAGTASDASTAAPTTLGTFKWSGDQEFAWRWGVAPDPTRTGGLVDGKLAGEYKWGDFKLLGAGQVRAGEYVPGETLVQWSPGAFKLTAGLSEFSWGLADANNPTDTLNARDYRHGANANRLVNPAVTAAWYPVDWLSLEAVYEPWKVGSRFPTDFGARLRAQFGSYGTIVSVRDDAQDGSRPVFGGRANFFLTGVDLSLSYVYDRDSYYTPVVTLKNIGVWVPSEIELVHKTVQRVGLNAKTTVDRFGLWFEGAYNITEDPTGTDDGVRDNKLAWTTGFDFNWGPSSAYYVNLQYAGSWIPGFQATPAAQVLTSQASAQKYFHGQLVNSLGSETEEWLHGVTYTFDFPLADALVTPSLAGAVMVPVGYDDSKQTRLASAYFRPEVDVAPVDGIHVLVGADLAYGWVKKAGSSDVTLDTTNDKLGIYTPQNSVYVKVQYKWNGSWGN